MKQCNTVLDVIPTNQPAVVVFSRGEKLSIDSKVSGETGNWKVNPERLTKIEKVVIYLRKSGENGGRVYLGNYTGHVLSKEIGRYIITFSKLEEICQTKSSWYEFAKTGPGPVRYYSC